MKIWLIRHGSTALSEARRYQGRLDEGLSENGKASLCRARFSPGQVYVSPARRARETADILFPGTKQRIVEDLREMDFGAFEGRGWWEMEQDPDYRNWVDGGCMGRCPGGEDRAEFSRRVCAAFEGILTEESESAELAVIAHGGTQMSVLERWGEPGREDYQWQRPCGCGWLLNWDGQTLQVLQQVEFLR